jgi:Pyridoxamine 5''-phosphate oxidase.
MSKEKLFDIINNTRFFTLSTTCEDGSPWGTPIGWFALDGNNIVFDNRQGTVHANNLTRDNRCFITFVNRDTGHSRAIYITTRATKLSGDQYEKAKALILEKGLNVSNDVFSAPIGDLVEEKSQIGMINGKDKFHCYMEAK